MEEKPIPKADESPPQKAADGKKGLLGGKVKKKNIELLIAVLLGVVAIVIYFSTFTSCSDKGTGGNSGEYVETLTKQLSATLGKIKGAGKVSVLITFEDSGETIYATNDEKLVETVTDGNKTTTETTEKSTVVIVGGKPLVERVLEPKVKGVLIVAEGGSDARVKVDLIRATQVALSVSANLIEVFAA